MLKINSKIIIGVIVTVIVLILVYLLLRPFSETGLILTITPADTTVLIDGESNYDLKKQISLSPGQHTITIFKLGYNHKEETVNIKRYGLTKIEISLTDKEKALLDIIPYVVPKMNPTIVLLEGTMILWSQSTV